MKWRLDKGQMYGLTRFAYKSLLCNYVPKAIFPIAYREKKKFDGAAGYLKLLIYSIML